MTDRLPDAAYLRVLARSVSTMLSVAGVARLNEIADGLEQQIAEVAMWKRVSESRLRTINRLSKECESTRDTLERIATEYPSVSGPITCPPSPHSCPKCEIQFLLEEALKPTPSP